MKLYRIETGKKIPPVSRAANIIRISTEVATMHALEPGQSFLVKDPAQAFQAGKSMRDFNRRERMRNGNREFVSRKVDTGLRIWRFK